MGKHPPSSPKLIAMTGGPCSGKSSVLESAKAKLNDVHIIPEAAAILIRQLGINPGSDPRILRNFQETICRLQRLVEESALYAAKISGKPAVVVDRGTVDNAAYMLGGEEEFYQIVGNSIQDEYKRYAAVICMAMPTKDVYEDNVANNPARYETYEKALSRSTATIDAWYKHPQFFYINSTIGWQEKKRVALDKIYQLIYTDPS